METGFKDRGTVMRKILLFLFIIIFSISSAFAYIGPLMDGDQIVAGGSSIYNFQFEKIGENHLSFFDPITKNEESDFFFLEYGTSSTYKLSIGMKYEIYDSSYKLSLIFSSGTAHPEGGGFMLSLVTVDEGSSALSKTTGLNYSVEIEETGKGLSFSGGAINSPKFLVDRTLVLVDNTNNQPIDSTMNSPLTLNLTLTPPPLDDNPNATGFIAGEYAGNIILRLESK